MLQLRRHSPLHSGPTRAQSQQCRIRMQPNIGYLQPEVILSSAHPRPPSASPAPMRRELLPLVREGNDEFAATRDATRTCFTPSPDFLSQNPDASIVELHRAHANPACAASSYPASMSKPLRPRAAATPSPRRRQPPRRRPTSPPASWSPPPCPLNPAPHLHSSPWSNTHAPPHPLLPPPPRHSQPANLAPRHDPAPHRRQRPRRPHPRPRPPNPASESSSPPLPTKAPPSPAPSAKATSKPPSSTPPTLAAAVHLMRDRILVIGPMHNRIAVTRRVLPPALRDQLAAALEA